MADELEAVYERPPVKVLHLHKLTGISGSEGHLLALLPALRAAGVDARFLGLDVPGTDAPRFYERLDAQGIPHRRVRCGPDVSAAHGTRRRPRGAGGASRPRAHASRARGRVRRDRRRSNAGVPYVSTRHNDDPYLLGPFRYVDRGFARGARRADRDLGRRTAVPGGGGPRSGAS